MKKKRVKSHYWRNSESYYNLTRARARARVQVHSNTKHTAVQGARDSESSKNESTQLRQVVAIGAASSPLCLPFHSQATPYDPPGLSRRWTVGVVASTLVPYYGFQFWHCANEFRIIDTRTMICAHAKNYTIVFVSMWHYFVSICASHRRVSRFNELTMKRISSSFNNPKIIHPRIKRSINGLKNSHTDRT